MSTAKINSVAYVTYQAALASREGQVSPRLADLFFQCTQVGGERTIEEWDALVNDAREAGVNVSVALEFAEP